MVKAKIISLDVFDTAIIRKVYHPTDIFDLVEDIVDKNFKNKRIEAEKKVQSINIYYNINDIYKYLPEFDKNLEIQLEFDNCEPNPKIKKFYNENKNNSTFIFISDMYLNHDIIKGILEKCGYKVDYLFVSCDCKCTKGSGDLFKYVMNKLNIKIDKHIGDSHGSDILGGKKASINVEHILALHNISLNIPNIKNKRLKKLIALSNYNNTNILKQYCNILAYVHYCFAKYLNDNLINKRLLCCSRDGYIIYKILKEIFKNKNAEYVYFSRLSTLLPALDINKSILDNKNFFQYQFIKFGRFKNFYNALDYLEIQCNSEDYIIDKNKEKYENFIKSNEYTIKQQSLKRKEKLIKYINKLSIDKDCILVDIGYTGSIQRSIEIVSNIDLKGVYLVLRAHEKESFVKPINKLSFLNSDIIGHRGGFIECFFSSDEGVVLDYDGNGNPIISEEKEEVKKLKQDIQNYILGFCNVLHKDNISISIGDCEEIIKHVINSPNKEICEIFNNKIFENGSINNYESIINFDIEEIKKGNLKEYYNKSYWREAFLYLLENSEYKNLKESVLGIRNNIKNINNNVTFNDKINQTMTRLETTKEKFYFYGCTDFCKQLIEKYPKIMLNSNFLGFLDNNVKVFFGRNVFKVQNISPNIQANIYLTTREQDLSIFNNVSEVMKKKIIKLS